MAVGVGRRQRSLGLPSTPPSMHGGGFISGSMYSRDEVLLDDARRLDEHARRAGVDVRLDIFPDMQHTFQMAAGRAPEADDAIRRMADWVQPKLNLSIINEHRSVGV